MKDDDLELVQRVQEGQRQAFRQLVEKYQKRVFHLAYEMTSDYEEAEDIVQEAFVKAYRSIDRFKRSARFSTWLYEIVTNLCIDYQRKRGPYVWLSLDDKQNGSAFDIEDRSIEANPEKKLAGWRMDEAVAKALDTLSSTQRLVFIQRYYYDISIKELGAMLGCAESTVRNHLFRAVQKLRVALKPYMEGRDENG